MNRKIKIIELNGRDTFKCPECNQRHSVKDLLENGEIQGDVIILYCSSCSNPIVIRFDNNLKRSINHE